ncbi:phosphonate ABC transporter ATP-binding protein [Cupriavidus sp. CP313]
MARPDILVQDLVVKAGGRTLLYVPELTIYRGERVALVGPNGAGKSTLLRALGGFIAPAQGRLSVLDRSFGPGVPRTLGRSDWRFLRAEIGQLLQGLHLVPRLTARENVILGALAQPGQIPLWRSWVRLYPASVQQKADAALSSLGLADRAGTLAGRLSGGERQKVSLARLQLQQPRLILADEPTSALDPGATAQACTALRVAAESATLVTVVHNASLIPLLAERVIGLAGGRIVFDGSPAEACAERLGRIYAGTEPQAA